MNYRKTALNVLLFVLGSSLICATVPIELFGKHNNSTGTVAYKLGLIELVLVSFLVTYIAALLLTMASLCIFRLTGLIPPYIQASLVVRELSLQAIFLATALVATVLTMCLSFVPALKEVFVNLLLGFGISFAAAGIMNLLFLKFKISEWE